jgi:hypothetical protein
MNEISWDKIIGQGPVIVLVALFLFFLWRTLPSWLTTWQAVKLADASAREKQAEAFGELSATLREIAVEQRRATDAIKLQSRVNADSNDSLSDSLEGLRDDIKQLNKRVDEIETR